MIIRYDYIKQQPIWELICESKDSKESGMQIGY